MLGPVRRLNAPGLSSARSGPFHHGLNIVFVMAICLLIIAAGVSLLRGGRYVYEDQVPAAQPESADQAALERTARP